MLSPPLSADLATATEMEGVANRRGYRTHRQPDGAWLARRSATAPGTLWLAGAGPRGPFYAATDHGGVAAEIPGATAGMPHPGVAAWRADTVGALDALVDAIYRLSVSLPAHPLALFQARLAEEPARPTEAEASRRIRIGQNVFRAALLDYWGSACPLTGIREAPLLRASHYRGEQVRLEACPDSGWASYLVKDYRKPLAFGRFAATRGFRAAAEAVFDVLREMVLNPGKHTDPAEEDKSALNSFEDEQQNARCLKEVLASRNLIEIPLVCGQHREAQGCLGRRSLMTGSPTCTRRWMFGSVPIVDST